MVALCHTDSYICISLQFIFFYVFLVFTGCGFVGRNLVAYLISHNLTSKIRVVDKVPPQVAWLNETHKSFINHESVEFKSANLINIGKFKFSICC